MLKLAILTTETPHHNYFVSELQNRFPIAAVFQETSFLKAPFDTAHPFEEEREQYEWERFFAGSEVQLRDLAETKAFPSVNDSKAVKELRQLAPDLIVAFGTGLIKPELIGIAPERIVNLHGADPQEYRGLDSHLWAIYHGDYAGLVVTLHRLNAKLDDGEIVDMQRLKLTREMKLAHLRAETTRACIELVEDLCREVAERGKIRSTVQSRVGRYYSFMPSVLKEICVRKFEAHTIKITA